jgi:hypothetical protein
LFSLLLRWKIRRRYAATLTKIVFIPHRCLATGRSFGFVQAEPPPRRSIQRETGAPNKQRARTDAYPTVKFSHECIGRPNHQSSSHLPVQSSQSINLEIPPAEARFDVSGDESERARAAATTTTTPNNNRQTNNKRPYQPQSRHNTGTENYDHNTSFASSRTTRQAPSLSPST